MLPQAYRIGDSQFQFTQETFSVLPTPIEDPAWQPTSATLSDGQLLPSQLITFDISTGNFTVFSEDSSFIGLYEIFFQTTAQASVLAGKSLS